MGHNLLSEVKLTLCACVSMSHVYVALCVSMHVCVCTRAYILQFTH